MNYKDNNQANRLITLDEIANQPPDEEHALQW